MKRYTWMLLVVALTCSRLLATPAESPVPAAILDFMQGPPELAASKRGLAGVQAVLAAYDVAGPQRQRHIAAALQEASPGLALLQGVRLHLVVDYSASMGAPAKDPEDQSLSCFSRKNGLLGEAHWAQWDNAFKIAKYLGESVRRFRRQGVMPCIFFASEVDGFLAEDSVDLLQGFLVHRPAGETNLHEALLRAFKQRLQIEEEKDPVTTELFVVLTDGPPQVDGKEQSLAMIKALLAKELAASRVGGLKFLIVTLGDQSGLERFASALQASSELAGHLLVVSEQEFFAEGGPEYFILKAAYDSSFGEPAP